jgi:hypothetical protein
VSDRTARRIRARLTAGRGHAPHGTPRPVPATSLPAQTPPGAAGDARREA